MSGMQFYLELSAGSIPMADRVMFITGDTARTATQRFLQEASRPVLEKPFEVEVLRKRVAAELMRLRSIDDQLQ